jgi:tetratricopeptide (TPR) repeat protein
MKYKFYLLTILICLGQTVSAQNVTTAKGKYLGQKPPGNIAQLFSPGIISSDSMEHSAPAFSPDGSSVLWTVITRSKPAYLLEMKYENGAWSKPFKPSFADSTADDFYPNFTADGSKLLFSSRRKYPYDANAQRDIGLWIVKKTSTGWEQAVPFDSTVATGIEYASSIASSGNVYFSCRKQQGRIFDIYHSSINNGNYLRPEPLPFNINTTSYEDGPIIAPDESYIIFESDRAGGVEGGIDLYISFKTTSGQWTTPVNMGPEVNSKDAERFAKISPDGKYLFFGSNRRKVNGRSQFDVYWIEADIISRLKKSTALKPAKLINEAEGNTILSMLYKNDYAGSIDILKLLYTNNPHEASIAIEYAKSLRKGLFFSEAEVVLKSISTNGVDVAVLTEKTLTALAQEKQLEASSNKSRVFTSLASTLMEMERNAQAAYYYEKALDLQPRGVDYYNQACAYAKSSNKDKAFASLNKAFDNGFSSKNDFENDTDLASLKTDNRWVTLMQKLDAPFNGSTPYKRAHHEMVYDEANKSVLMIGGSTPLNGGQSGKFFNDIWKYNNSGWSKIANAGDERSGIRLAYDTKRNKIFSFGGLSNNGSLDDLRVLENNQWQTISHLPEMKAAESGFVYDIARDKFIAFGGSAARGQVNNITWEWDGTTWKKFEGKSPDGRQAFAMVYDSKRNKTILYGGADGNRNTFNDGVWEFDGTVWKNIVTENNPGERISPGYAFDSKRNLLILFGGISKGAMMNDLWAWDGTNWKLLSTDGPAKRTMGYLAYDKNRDKIILFGGRLGWPNDADDTWEWDGEKWNEVK